MSAASRVAVALTLGLILLAGCEPGDRPHRPGTTYRELARPEVWRLLSNSQAEKVGLQPGDLLLSYNGEPVLTNADVLAAQESALDEPGPVEITVLREERELRFEVKPGPLGVMPVARRHPSSLAVALEDIMWSLGLFSDYDWLSALSGESFAPAAAEGECRAWWPGGAADSYLEDLALMAGLELRQVYPTTEPGGATRAIRDALDSEQAVLVRGGWPVPRNDFWGVATRFAPDEGERGVLYGFTLDEADEQPLVTGVAEAYAVEPGLGWDDLDEVLALALTQALELGLARTDFGWQTGLQAYDMLIAGLDTVPFCPVCGPEESPVCFDRLIWALVANKESAIRFLTGMREVLPEEVVLIDEIVGDLRAQVGRLEGIARSRARIGVLEEQWKIARAIAEVQVIENDLLGQYEELLGRL